MFCFVTLALSCMGQSYNTERTTLAQFLTRMYKNAPFEGVRVVEDYEHTYLMSVLSLDVSKYNGNISTMNRVASVKAMSQASRFFNGSTITDDLVIRITEKSDGVINTETIEKINENSIGYVQGFELLTDFPDESGKTVFLFITEVK